MLLSGTHGRPAGLVRPLRRGVAGNVQTLEAMADWVRSDYSDIAIVDFANSLVEGVSSHTPETIVRQVFFFVRGFKDKNGKHWGITYRSDPFGFEQLQDSRATLERGVGDCGDKVILLATLLAALGIPSRFAVLSYTPPAFQHVYTEAFYEGQWHALDPTPEEAMPGWHDSAALMYATYEVFARSAPNISGFDWSSLFSAGSAVGGAAAQGGKTAAITTAVSAGLQFIPIPGVGQALSALVGPIASLFGKTARNKPFSDARDSIKEEVYGAQQQIREAVDDCLASPGEGVAASKSLVQEYYKQCDETMPKAIAASCRNFESMPGGFKTREDRIADAGKSCGGKFGPQAAAGGGGSNGASGVTGASPVSVAGVNVNPWLLAGGGALALFLVSSFASRR